MTNVGGDEGVGVLLGLGFVVVVYGAAIWTLVDAARRPDWQFAATGKSRTTWIVIPIISMVCCGLVGLVGFIVYFASVRPQLERAQFPWPTWSGAPPGSPGAWPGPPVPPDAPSARWEIGGGIGDDQPPPPPPPPPPSPPPPPPSPPPPPPAPPPPPPLG